MAAPTWWCPVTSCISEDRGANRKGGSTCTCIRHLCARYTRGGGIPNDAIWPPPCLDADFHDACGGDPYGVSFPGRVDRGKEKKTRASPKRRHTALVVYRAQVQ